MSLMSSIGTRLEAHFAAGAAMSAVLIAHPHDVEAAIVYSGIVNISIPGNFAGVYLNLVTGLTGTSAASVPGHDFNPYYGGNRLFMSNFLGNNAVGTGSGIAVANAPPQWFMGPVVGASSPFITSTDFPTMENFTPGSPGIIGVRFRRESDSMILYGAVGIIRSASNTTPGMISWYGYENFGATFVPVPGSLAMLALGALGLRGRKRT
jgi:hypothetical protein